MKRYCLLFLLLLLLLFAIFPVREPAVEAAVPESVPSTVPAAEILPTEPEVLHTEPEVLHTELEVLHTELEVLPSEPETIPATTEPMLFLTEKEKNMLLKLGMAERGNSECKECIALIMRTVLNRTEVKHFGDDIRSVITAPGQFTPVSNGSYYSAEPNQLCYEALEMVICGWDESQGALYYEWCESESWHSKNLNLLFQHCDVRFYDEKRK